MHPQVLINNQLQPQHNQINAHMHTNHNIKLSCTPIKMTLSNNTNNIQLDELIALFHFRFYRKTIHQNF